MDQKEVIAALLDGKVALLPTDTVYGLAASPLHPDGVDRIFMIKGRPKQVNLPIMVHTGDHLASLGFDINPFAKKLLHSPFIPGGLTLVLGFDPALPRAPWLEGREEAAIRIPADQWLLQVLEGTGPLLVTSANAHGSKASMGNVAEILAEIHQQPDVVIDHGILSTIPSTIVNCRYEELKVEREGQLSFERIKNWVLQ